MARRNRPDHKKSNHSFEKISDAIFTESDTQGTTLNLKFNLLPYVLVFAFGFLLYANTIPFDYALDDKLYITANEYTKKGIDGIHEIWTNDMMTGFFGKKKNLVEGGRYRPLALTTHAIEYHFFGESPRISHFLNVVLYALMGVVLLLVLNQIFGWKEERWWWSIPLVATLLFLAHPTHTEVAANIKSRDEILSLLFALLAFYAVLQYLKTNATCQLLLSGLWFLASLLSKESTLTFLGVVPLTLIFFPKGSFKSSLIAISPLIMFTGIYVLIRLYALGAASANPGEVAKELMNQPYLLATSSERLASIFFTMGIYLKLLLWPDPLTHDYYPFHPFRTYAELEAGSRQYVDWSNGYAMFSLVVYLTLAIIGFYFLMQRIKGKSTSIVGYGILFYLGTFILFSNLFFDIGAFMNERFLFIPSLGFTLILSWLLIEKVKIQRLGYALFAILIIGYSGKTIARNYAWENDYALASADILTSDGSAKIKMTMGSELLDQAKEKENASRKQELLKEAERYCLQSLKIYTKYFPPLDILGNIYFEMENYPYSVHYFQQAVKLKPNDDRILNNLEAVANVSVQKKEFESAIKGFKTLTKYRSGKKLSNIYSSLGEVYGKEMQDMDNAMRYLRMARTADPRNPNALQKLGIVYAMTGKADSALQSFNEALSIEPQNAQVLLNLGTLYYQLGNPALGKNYVDQAKKIDPKVKGG